VRAMRHETTTPRPRTALGHKRKARVAPAVVLSIQVLGDDGRYDHFYRIPCADSKVDTLRAAITEWARKPSEFLIGEGKRKWQPSAPPKRADDERAIPEMPGV
jgi:hypothetical protein